MRILLVYKNFPPVIGGVERYLSLLTTGLTQTGIDVDILTTWDKHTTREEQQPHISIYKAGHWGHISSAPLSLPFFRIFEQLARESDLIHLNIPYPPADLAYLISAYQKPLVITYHADIVRQRISGRLYRPFLRQILKKAHQIIVSSQAYIDTSLQLQPYSNKCVVIPISIPVEAYKATPAITARAHQYRHEYADMPLLLFIGKMRHYKGVDILIRAMDQISSSHLLLVGDGPLLSTWRSLARSSPAHRRIHFLGELSEMDKIACLHAADIFILPSINRAESWGMVLLEAMACSLPLISTELGTGTSVINEHNSTGLVIPPNDSSALAQTVNYLLEHPQLRKNLGQNGRIRCENYFHVHQMIQQTIEVYTHVVQKPLYQNSRAVWNNSRPDLNPLP